jgi:hypothetical protein
MGWGATDAGYAMSYEDMMIRRYTMGVILGVGRPVTACFIGSDLQNHCHLSRSDCKLVPMPNVEA